MKQREQGVTLIEIAVVLAIVAIMGLFLAPAIGEWFDNFRIRQAARDISSTLQQAKMQTISTKTTNSVDFNTSNNTYTLQPEGKVSQVPRGVNIASVTAATVSFSLDGTSGSSSTEIITIANADGVTYQIIVNAVGRVSIQEI